MSKGMSFHVSAVRPFTYDASEWTCTEMGTITALFQGQSLMMIDTDDDTRSINQKLI